MGTHLTLTASDDHKFDAYRVDPAGTPKGGIVVIQELFGVNRHIRSVADRFAALGYVAIAPALFDRIEAGFESGYSPEEVQAARRFVANPPMQAWILDIAAAREAIADVGKIAVTGFCLGGTLSYGAAANLPGFSVAVGYYGGHIVRMVDQSPKIPTMLHFGELDTHIPMSDVETIKSKQPSIEVYTYKADHGFQCDERDNFSPEAAQIAWGRTLRFIDSDNGMELTSNAVLISNIDGDCHQSYLLDETYGSDVANRSRQHSARHRRNPENSSHLPRRADRRARADDHPPAAPVLLGAIWSNPLHGGNADLDLRALPTCFGPAARPLERPRGPQAPPDREPGWHLPGILAARLRKLPAADFSFPHHRRLHCRQRFIVSGLYFRRNPPRKTRGRIRQDRHGLRDRFLRGSESHVLPLPIRP